MGNSGVVLGVIGIILWFMSGVLNRKNSVLKDKIWINFMRFFQFFTWVWIPVAYYSKVGKKTVLIYGVILGILSMLVYMMKEVNLISFKLSLMQGGERSEQEIKTKNIQNIVMEDIAGLFKSIWMLSLIQLFVDKDDVISFVIAAGLGIFSLIIYVVSLIRNIQINEWKILKFIPRSNWMVNLELIASILFLIAKYNNI